MRVLFIDASSAFPWNSRNEELPQVDGTTGQIRQSQVPGDYITQNFTRSTTKNSFECGSRVALKLYAQPRSS